MRWWKRLAAPAKLTRRVAMTLQANDLGQISIMALAFNGKLALPLLAG